MTSLHARSLKRCVLIVDVEGSAILHGLDDCVVVLSCHQVCRICTPTSGAMK